MLSDPPWVPILARLPVGVSSASARLSLDGQPWTDPLMVVRRRNKTMGGGVDLLATLPLLDLSAGAHRIGLDVTLADGAPLHLDSAFVYRPPPILVNLLVIDAQDQPVPARIALFQDGEPHALAGPDALRVDPQDRDTHLNSLFALGGRAQVRLSPGRYRLVAVRGLRDELGIAEVDLTEDSTLTLRVTESVPTPGQLTADLHVHTAASGDAFVPGWARYASLAAAGLDMVVITDHERIVDPRPALSRLGATVQGLPGEEAFSDKKRARDGHMNALPLEAGQPYDGDRALAALIDGFRTLADSRPFPGANGAVLLQLNHPRGIQFAPEDPPLPWAHGLFTTLGFNRESVLGAPENAWLFKAQPGTGTNALDVEAMEIINRFSWSLYREVRADWFALLNAGFAITGTGNSDSHALAVETAGLPVNLVSLPGWSAGQPIPPDAFVGAIQAGHVSVSTGPVLSMRLRGPDGAEAGPGDLIQAAGPITVTASVAAASWVRVPELRLIVNGEVEQRIAVPRPAPGQPSALQQTWIVDLPRDGWILVEAGWPIEEQEPVVDGDYAALFPGHVPMAFTNPARVDVDGDGRWRP